MIPHASALTKDGEEVPWLWKESFLVRNRRAMEEAKQLPSRSMVQMEDMSSSALPSTDTSNVSGPNKYAQIGGDGAAKLLRAAVAP